MSRNRFRRDRGFVSPSRLPKGPNGRNLCRWCSIEVPPKRQTFCSAQCVHEWKLRTDATYVRRQVYARDKGVCAKCGLDTEALQKALIEIWLVDSLRAHQNCWIHGFGNAFKHVRLRWGHYPKPRSLWEADHIIPVAEGGGECSISNYRTMCIPCHKQESKALMGRLSVKRRKSLLKERKNGTPMGRKTEAPSSGQYKDHQRDGSRRLL